MKKVKPVDRRGKKSQLNHRQPVPTSKPVEHLQPASGEDTPQKLKLGWQRVAAQAEHINQLAAELEAAMLEFKAIASQVNCERRIIQTGKKPLRSVCEYVKAIVPYVEYQKSRGFILTTRSIDLFRAEREALQVAKTLRRQAKRNQLISSISHKTKFRVLGWLI